MPISRKQLEYSAKCTLFATCAIVTILGFVPKGRAQKTANALSGVNKAAIRFEVASVRPAPDIASVMSVMGSGGRPHLGTRIDGDRVDIGSGSLMGLFCMAYSARIDQVSGPDWMSTERFDVLAKIPTGATKDQVPEMMQALLEERFKLAFHRTGALESVYALLVGPKGEKLEPGVPDPKLGRDEKGAGTNGGGFGGGNLGTLGGQIGNGLYGPQRVAMSNGVIRTEFYDIDMKGLAEYFSSRVGRRVLDMSGLLGKYHMVLEFSVGDGRASDGNTAAPAGDQSPTLSAAPDSQAAGAFAAIDKLGLKLDSRKVPVEQFVIDHVEKLPTEN